MNVTFIPRDPWSSRDETPDELTTALLTLLTGFGGLQPSTAAAVPEPEPGALPHDAERDTAAYKGVLWEGIDFPCEHPYLEVIEPCARPRNHNGYVHEDTCDVLRRAHITLNMPPVSAPFEPERFTPQRWTRSDCDLPATPANIWIDEDPVTGPWALIERLSAVGSQRFLKAERLCSRGLQCRFNASDLAGLGGRAGLFLHNNLMKLRYRPFIWDTTTRPCRPISVIAAPSSRCSWRLDLLVQDFARRGYTDTAHFAEAAAHGFHDRSTGARHTWLCLPYPPYFDKDDFVKMQRTMADKRVCIPPKLGLPHHLPTIIPAHSCPKSIATRWHDGKKRIISDMGGDRSRGPNGEPNWPSAGRNKPSPASINGRTDTDNRQNFPACNWLVMHDAGIMLQVLLAVRIFCPAKITLEGLHVDQWKTDL